MISEHWKTQPRDERGRWTDEQGFFRTNTSYAAIQAYRNALSQNVEEAGTIEPQRELLNSADGSITNGSEDLYRKATNSGAFSDLPERMSKKHIREVAKSVGIDLKGITINIDAQEDLLRIIYTGRTDYEQIGGITFFPNAFRSRENLIRTIYHEKTHIEQCKKYGKKFVQENIGRFESEAYQLEEEFITKLKERGLL